MRFSTAKSMVSYFLAGAGFTNIAIQPGPKLPDVPEPFVVLTPYGGSGLIVDGALESQSWQVRVVGRQMDYGSAEDMATAIDLAFISWMSDYLFGTWITSIQRVGGAPSPLMVDDADRTHFTCNYNIDSESALVN